MTVVSCSDQCGLCSNHQSGECFCIVHCKIGKDLAVNFDTCSIQASNEMSFKRHAALMR